MGWHNFVSMSGLLIYVHGKWLSSCQDRQLLYQTDPAQASMSHF